MGNPVSKAKESAAAEKKNVDSIVQTLQNKLDAYEAEVMLKRGDAVSKTEVTGGRTVMRVSQIRVATQQGPDEQLMAAIDDFFTAAQGGVSGDNDAAKRAALGGAQKLLKAGLNALFGVSKGQSMSKKSFCVLFMNNAFVRVDYFVYTYSVSAEAWGAAASEAGSCYLADLAVLKTQELSPDEINFLLSQALAVDAQHMDALTKIKLNLIEQSVLSRMLSKPDISLDAVLEAAKKLASTQKAIDDAFKDVPVNEVLPRDLEGIRTRALLR